MTEKELNKLEMSAWNNDNFKVFNRVLKQNNAKIGKIAVIEEFVRGKFKPSYKRLEVLDGKKFVGCIFAPLNYKG